jgi:uncharacterized protein YutE (UPF0331/DUF86 family)
VSDLDPEKFKIRLQALDEYKGILKETQPTPRDEFISNVRVYGLAERYLHLAIETLIDLAHLLVAGLGWRRPVDNADAMIVLAEQRVVPRDFADTLARMVRFRNILVHVYLDIDRSLVYEVLQNRLGDFDRFAECLRRFLVDELQIDMGSSE